jgi:hypothetical protein
LAWWPLHLRVTPNLVSCYSDAEDLNEVKGWLQLARQTPEKRGFMCTPWQRKYSLLPAFGDLLAK